jgi:serine/threonine-protein kinase
VALVPGTRIGIYEITASIGEGGMGAVYRARDTQLGRDVALKVLPDSFSNDPDRVARFTREAQVLASLDHPNIATIYGLERVGTNQIIVMEMVEGATLEARLAHGPLAVDEARHVGMQIADALDAAHERGIVHRDLKPSNVVIRPDGNVRVLDFGLAKTLPATSPDAAGSMSPTVTTGPATSAGVILGTAPYMSPEQSRGNAVDRRTDIWALGCLLYECVTGRRAFAGSTLSDTLAHILTSDPDWSRLPANTPAAMSALIRRCLRRDLRQRMQSAGDVRLALEDDDGNTSTPVVRRSSRAAGWVFGGAVVLFASALALFLSNRSAPQELVPPTAVRADVVFPDQAPLWFEDGNSLAMSPDGRLMAWVGGTGSARALWVRAVDQLEAHALAGTEEATSPFFSPDGEWLGFYTPTALKKLRIAGGGLQTLAPITDRPRGAAWGADESIVFASAFAPLKRISATGEGAAAITQLRPPGARAGRSPVWVPGRQVVLCEVRSDDGSGSQSIIAVDLASANERIIIEDAAQPAFLPNGDLLFLRGATLFVVAFDADTLRPAGEPRVVVPRVQSGANSLIGQFATGGGRLVYLPGQGASGKSLNVVEWRGLSGDPRLLISEPGTYRDLRFSPDGQRLAYSAWVPVETNATDLFVYDLQRDVKIRLAGDVAAAEWRPVWTSDGRFIVYADYSPGKSSNGIHRIRADGSGQPEQLTTATDGAMQVPVSISPDGKYLAYQEQGGNQPADIWILPMSPTGAPFRFFTSSASDTLPVFSPDGRWIAYASDESGANELYIRPFPKADAKWRVSSSGTLDEHAWSRDGKRLLFRAGDGQHFMAAPVSVAADALTIGRPASIFTLEAENYPELGFWGGMALSPDDRGFALAKFASETGRNRNRVVLMLDWIDAMPRTVPGSPPR